MTYRVDYLPQWHAV